MSSDHDERERLRRLRDRQVQLRDPRKADRKVQQAVASRHRARGRQRFTLKGAIATIPHQWRGLILGVLLGICISIVLPLLFEGTWPELVGLASIPVLGLLGFAMGQAFDVREELRDFSRRK